MTPANSVFTRAGHAYVRAEAWIDKLQSVAALAIRLYLANVFIASALTKIRDWSITLALFENEYHVPLLPPAAAALLGTAAEFGLPLLLLAGIGTRLAALALFAFNAVAVISYPDLSDAGLKDHILWGTLMLVLAVYGPGKLSVDALLSRRT
jgi:putative oxidoreductase